MGKSVQIQRFQDEQQKFKPKHCLIAQWVQQCVGQLQ